MISNRLRELITTQLRLHLDEDEYRYIESMFSECYLTKVNGHELITLKPHPSSGDIAMQFLALNGTYVEITSWEYIKTIGEKL